MEENNNVEVTSSVTNVEQPPVEEPNADQPTVEETNAPVVDPKQKKGGTGIIVLLVLLVLLVLGLAGYICYDKFMAPKPSVKCNANSTDTGNKDLKEKKDADIYTYKDIAGTYEFEKVIPNSKEEYGEEFTYVAYIELLDNGIIKYDDWVHSSKGYVGNYIIDGNDIIVTKWFEHGSDWSLHVEKAEETIYHLGNNTINLDNCNNGEFTNCLLKKTVNPKYQNDFTELTDFLTRVNSYSKEIWD